MSTSYCNKTRYLRRKCICRVSTSKSFAGQSVRFATIKCFQNIKLGAQVWLERKNTLSTMLGQLYSDPYPKGAHFWPQSATRRQIVT